MSGRAGSSAFSMSPDGKEVVFSCGGETKSSVEGADWKDWPGSFKDAYAECISWCGTRVLAIFQHGEPPDDHRMFRASMKRSLRVRDAGGEWTLVSTPGEKSPRSLANAPGSRTVWLIAK
ncbi:MAG: hypothetical protein FD180_2890 [Planctomycetota bacterium]|nr:MAG: hypothetical protein FD180_2890 [Planctomycetota bacterium]